jgi:dUTP pyrophosphatase
MPAPEDLAAMKAASDALTLKESNETGIIRAKDPQVEALDKVTADMKALIERKTKEMALLFHEAFPLTGFNPEWMQLQRGSEQSAGYDLRAIERAWVSSTGGVTKVRTGLHVAIPVGYVGLIMERSGLGSKGVAVRGGVIDSDYRGELVVMLEYRSQTPNEQYIVERGDKVAQLVLVRHFGGIPQGRDSLEGLGTTDRGEKGFGSTGR